MFRGVRVRYCVPYGTYYPLKEGEVSEIQLKWCPLVNVPYDSKAE